MASTAWVLRRRLPSANAERLIRSYEWPTPDQIGRWRRTHETESGMQDIICHLRLARAVRAVGPFIHRYVAVSEDRYQDAKVTARLLQI